MAQKNLTLSGAAMNAEAGAIAALLNGGALALYSGQRPVSPAQPISPNPPVPLLLARLALANPAFAAAAGGSALANAIAAVAPLASGHADWFRAFDSGAPAAPVPTTATTGGTVAAGIYGVQVTYVTAAGETVGSAAGTVTTTGATSTITVPSPAANPAATGWYAYVTAAGGSTYFRQQAAGSPTAIGTPLVITAPPTNTGLQPPATSSAGVAIGTPHVDGNAAADGSADIQLTIEEVLQGGPNVGVVSWPLWGPWH